MGQAIRPILVGPGSAHHVDVGCWPLSGIGRQCHGRSSTMMARAPTGRTSGGRPEHQGTDAPVLPPRYLDLRHPCAAGSAGGGSTINLASGWGLVLDQDVHGRRASRVSRAFERKGALRSGAPGGEDMPDAGSTRAVRRRSAPRPTSTRVMARSTLPRIALE